ncbi:MAG: hypothetical protein K2G01_02360, partial [Paramuribaculum sp.]|nr:hypothetical protein [Paramuribaculum sp.]
LCDAYGIESVSVATRAELPDAIRRLVDSPRPMLLNVNIDETDMVFPMTPPGAAVDFIMINQTETYRPES